MLKRLLKRFKCVDRFAFNIYSRLAFCLSRFWHASCQTAVETDRCGMLILTIAFNNEKLIERQFELIKTNIKDQNYRYMVGDNSTSSTKRRAIRQVCQKYGIDYIAVPRIICFLTNNQVAVSHGAALNWVYYHVLRKMKPRHFAIIDHDIFPVKPYNMSSAVSEQDFYGVSRIFNGEWYLWAGWCIFDFDKFTAKPDFLPLYTKKNFLDTGGGNYQRFYRRYEVGNISFPAVRSLRYKKTEGLKRHSDIYHSDYIQIVDESWLHVINGSNWANIPGKEDVISQILTGIDQFYDTVCVKIREN